MPQRNENTANSVIVIRRDNGILSISNDCLGKGKGIVMNEEMNKEVSQEDLDAVLAILDNFGKSETGRLKVKVSDSVENGKVEKQYHMGRCDIGSAWARGQSFDVLEDPKNALMNEKNHGCK